MSSPILGLTRTLAVFPPRSASGLPQLHLLPNESISAEAAPLVGTYTALKVAVDKFRAGIADVRRDTYLSTEGATAERTHLAEPVLAQLDAARPVVEAAERALDSIRSTAIPPDAPHARQELRDRESRERFAAMSEADRSRAILQWFQDGATEPLLALARDPFKVLIPGSWAGATFTDRLVELVNPAAAMKAEQLDRLTQSLTDYLRAATAHVRMLAEMAPKDYDALMQDEAMRARLVSTRGGVA